MRGFDHTASATGEEISVLADRMKASVFDEFGIVLEPEVRICKHYD